VYSVYYQRSGLVDRFLGVLALFCSKLAATMWGGGYMIQKEAVRLYQSAVFSLAHLEEQTTLFVSVQSA